MRLEDIRKSLRDGEAVRLEVHALSASVYQVFQHTRNGIVPVTMRGGRSMLYRSRYAALQALADIGLDQVDCVHRSAYGEMIGMDGSLPETELRESVPIAPLRGGSGG